MPLGDRLKWMRIWKSSFLTRWPSQPQCGAGDDGRGWPACSTDLVLRARTVKVTERV